VPAVPPVPPPGQTPPGGGNPPPGESPSNPPPSSPSATLVSANGSYTAAPGESHTADFTASQAYNSVYWYVKSPSETGLGTNVEIAPGGSDALTASLTYTFPVDASGDYVLTAYAYNFADSAAYQVSYTVAVSSSSDPDPEPEPDPPGSVVPAPGSSPTAAPGETHTSNFTADEAYEKVLWYVKSPSETGLGTLVETDIGGSGVTTASLSYTFASDASGDYDITAYVYPYGSGAVYQVSHTVSVSSSSSDPDPPASVPGAPAYFDTISMNGADELLWDPPASDGGSPASVDASC